MPYPLRPANPAAVKAKNALFMRVLLGAERYDGEGERPDWRRLVDLSAFRTLRGQLCHSNVRELYWFRFCASGREVIYLGLPTDRKAHVSDASRFPKKVSAALKGGAAH